MRSRALALPGRHSRRIQPVADARDDASHDELRQGIRCRLQKRAHNHNTRAQEDRAPATEDVADEDACYCACLVVSNHTIVVKASETYLKSIPNYS